jgi:hypothetical protein
MKKYIILILFLLVFFNSNIVLSETYLLHEHWGGMWSDAEKSSINTEDDLMCWAAAASNILSWTDLTI